MPDLPIVSSEKAIRAFGKFGWRMARSEGSHRILTKPGSSSVLSIPDRRELARGTLRGLIRTAGLSVQEFVDAIK